jgi:hypothetical protein
MARKLVYEVTIQFDEDEDWYSEWFVEDITSLCVVDEITGKLGYGALVTAIVKEDSNG